MTMKLRPTSALLLSLLSFSHLAKSFGQLVGNSVTLDCEYMGNLSLIEWTRHSDVIPVSYQTEPSMACVANPQE